MTIPKNILDAEFAKLVELEIEKINIAESIKMIKEQLVEEGLEKADVAVIQKIASAKAKEATQGLNDQADLLKTYLDILA